MDLRRTALVVGCHYYSGITSVQVGLELTLHREPNNPHDRNAIAVWSPSGVMLGHLCRADAATLAPILDDGHPVTTVVESVQPSPGRIRVFVNIGNNAPPSQAAPKETPKPLIQREPVNSAPLAPLTLNSSATSQDGSPVWIWVVAVAVIVWLLMRK